MSVNKLTTITLSSCLTGMALVSGIAQAQTKIGIIDIREIVTQSE
jgi:Skp family chaperone for outer membrane proteins